MKFSLISKSVAVTFLLVFIACIDYVAAVPSYPKPVKVEQADGTSVTVCLYGDERFNYATSVDGYQLVSQKGIYYYATIKGTEMVSTGVRAKDPIQRSSKDRDFLNKYVQRGVPYATESAASLRAMSSPFMYGAVNSDEPSVYNKQMVQTRSSGEQFKSLVIIVEFPDKLFSVADPKSDFDRMLNEPGYSSNQATGSARDYYMDNSNGKFNPQFDVAGPYVMSKSVYEYPGNEQDFIIEACNIAERNGVDFSQYVDNGILRDVFIFFAGYNNAEVGGGSFIHPARMTFEGTGYDFGTWGGGRLISAAYTSELKGASGANMAGIGTFCHEFGHILGWLDFYDTNYTQNGSGFNLDIFSLMATGSYVNEGRTPPALSAYERSLTNWIELTEITEPGNYVLEPVYNDKGYIINTVNSGEFFVFEYRNGTLNKWDKLLSEGNTSPETAFPAYGSGSGMLVYHIDKSNNKINGSLMAKDLWSSRRNLVNAYGDHECMRLVMASKVQRSGGVLRDFGKIFFPGRDNVTRFTATSAPLFVGWDGYTTGLELYDIKENGAGNVTFEVKKVDNSGLKDFKTIAGQNNIGVSFVSPFNDKYIIKCQEIGGAANVITKSTTEHGVNFERLKPGVKYLITATLEDSATILGQQEVTTERIDPNKVPSLIVSGSYSVNDYIILGYRNVQSDVQSVVWTINGKEYTETAVKLPAKPVHEIMAKITTADGVEYLVKYVNVE